MIPAYRRAGLIALALVAAVLAAEAATITMPLSQVKPGMKGRGRSVFQGRTIEDFEVEILGVIENSSPKRSIILARLKGRGLESTGVIAGMSGSPVYIDGKLIGAVASGFSFSKEAIAGITPIEEMLAVGKTPEEPRTGAAAPVIIRDDTSQEGLSGAYLKTLATGAAGAERSGAGLRAPGAAARRQRPLRRRLSRRPGRSSPRRAFWPCGAGAAASSGPWRARPSPPSGKATPWASSSSAATSTSPPWGR